MGLLPRLSRTLLTSLLPLLLLLLLLLPPALRPKSAPLPLDLSPARAPRARALAVFLLLPPWRLLPLLPLLLLRGLVGLLGRLLLQLPPAAMPMLAVLPASRVAPGVPAPGGMNPVAGPVHADGVLPDGLADLLPVASCGRSRHLGPCLSLGLIRGPTHSTPS